ncbi:MAG: V-type ATP synthase subunit D [Candidatus Bathyarchaeia archaeon]
MSQTIVGIHPTRMELLELKKRVKIAERGRDLLREKLDALMIEFFQFIHEISNLRERTHEILSQAYKDFSEAQVRMGFMNMLQTSLSIEDRFSVEAGSRDVIGISIPVIETKAKLFENYPYNPLNTSIKLDEGVLKMNEAIKLISELAESEVAVRKLGEAIAATKRRVNCLEYVIIPRIASTIKYIQIHLEEREREDLFRLKRIKKRLGKESKT